MIALQISGDKVIIRLSTSQSEWEFPNKKEGLYSGSKSCCLPENHIEMGVVHCRILKSIAVLVTELQIAKSL